MTKQRAMILAAVFVLGAAMSCNCIDDSAEANRKCREASWAAKYSQDYEEIERGMDYFLKHCT